MMDVEQRQAQELMAELHREPTKGFQKMQRHARYYGASHKKRLEMRESA